MHTAASHRRLHTPPRVDREVIIFCKDIHGQDYSERLVGNFNERHLARLIISAALLLSREESKATQRKAERFRRGNCLL